jgi:Domain of unknown function DUF11
VRNTGTDAATGVSLSDILPSGTTFNSFSAATGWTATTPAAGGTGTVSATIASLAPNASASFSLVLQVDSSAANGATINDSAEVIELDSQAMMDTAHLADLPDSWYGVSRVLDEASGEGSQASGWFVALFRSQTTTRRFGLVCRRSNREQS